MSANISRLDGLEDIKIVKAIRDEMNSRFKAVN